MSDALPELHADRLRAFLAVAREHGFSKAARALGQTQSSISQAVRALEDELGEPLFVRDVRDTQLTEAGSILAEHAERAFSEIARAREALFALRNLTRGTLRVGTSDTLATYVLPAVFGLFRGRYPGVELKLDNRPSPAIAERVAEREVDLGVISLPLPSALRIRGRPASEVLRFEPLCSQEDVLICPPSHRLAGRTGVKLEELADEVLVLLDRTTATRALVEASFAARGLVPRVGMEMSSVEVVKRLVELSFGLSIVPALSARRELSQGSLCAVRLEDENSTRQVGLITSTHGPLSHASRAFVEVLRSELRETRALP